MNVLLTNTLQIFHVNLQELYPRLTTYIIVIVIATAFCDCSNTRNKKHMCSNGVKYCEKQWNVTYLHVL